MTYDELEQNCRESEKFTEECGLDDAEAGFNVVLPATRYGESVRIAPGLSGRNLGHIDKGTLVFLKVSKVRAFLLKEGYQASTPGNPSNGNG